MSIDVQFLEQVYQRFNARDIEAVLAGTPLRCDVGRWQCRQGTSTAARPWPESSDSTMGNASDPRVEPTAFSAGADGDLTIVEVHQTVRDLQGAVLVDQMVGHIFRIENGLITRFDIRAA